jgi:hypothetical protein
MRQRLREGQKVFRETNTFRTLHDGEKLIISVNPESISAGLRVKRGGTVMEKQSANVFGSELWGDEYE